MMLCGLPLDAALRELNARGESAQVTFTSSPRRAREQDALTEIKAPERVARVVRQLPGQLVCAWFNEPRP
ncbi:MAG: hypothetical protein ACOYIH_11860 [Candidatus Fimadaptatus sp.]|jgi:hypothetical protein